MEEEQNTQEIDLMELVRLLLSRWYIIAGSIIAVLSLTTIFAYGFLEDEYTADASILVAVEREGMDEHVDFQFGQRLIATYTDVAESRTVAEALRNELDLEYSDRRIREMIDVQPGRDESIMIKFTATSNDPEEAALMANEIVNVINELAVERDALYDTDILDTAQIPENPSGPNRPLYLAVGLVLGGMIGVLSVMGIEFFDKSVKTSKDLENKLDLRVLGTIPEYEMEKEVKE